MKYLNINYKIFTVFLLLALLLKYNTVSAQKCENYLTTPDVFNEYCKTELLNKINSGAILLESLKSTNLKCWEVFSDRSDNTLYWDPDGAVKDEKLEYMEKLVVKKISGNWLLVYSQIYDKTNPIQYNKERGWIKAENLILSKYSILNEKSTPRKAMILVSIGNIDMNNISSEQILNNKFYFQPEPQVKNETGKKAKKFDIYFVLKETKGSVLLSKSDKLNASQQELKVNVPGWIPKSNVTFWDHRVCLELAYRPDVVVKKYENKEIPIFGTKTALDNFLSTQLYNKKEVVKKYIIKPKRQDPKIMRMPIIQNYDQTLKEVATIGNIGSDVKVTEEERVKIERKIQEIKDKIENIDILFVVDGTKSIAQYYPAIANSISQTIQNNKIKNSNNRIRFGLAIYRDYFDDDKAIEVLPLTGDNEKVINKVLTTECFSKNPELPESQYNGMIKGINDAGFNPAYSNIVVLIGDAGNHNPDPKGITIDNVTDLLYKQQISLIAFQAINGRDVAFRQFNRDAQKYLTGTAEKYTKGSNTKIKIEDISIKNTYKLNFTTSTNKQTDLFMFGRFTYASGDKAMDVQILEENIVQSINEYLKRVDQTKSDLEAMLGGDFPEDAMLEYLKNKGFKPDELQKLIEILKRADQITAKGNTSLQYYETGINCFTPVVFLSYDEKLSIDRILKQLIRDTQSSTQKKKGLQTALLEQCKKMLGDVSDENILNKNLNEIWDVILAVPFTGNQSISKTMLRDIDRLNDESFNEFYSKFEESAYKFIRNDFGSSKFELADQYFFWIPLNNIPGNE